VSVTPAAEAARVDDDDVTALTVSLSPPLYCEQSYTAHQTHHTQRLNTPNGKLNF